MEFQKERCYTAVNADQLKVGSKVIVADALAVLKAKVEETDGNCCGKNVNQIESILNEEFCERFEVTGNIFYALCYLVAEPEGLKWTDLKIGDTIENENSLTCMVTAIDAKNKDGIHIYAGDLWLSDSELAEDWEKVNC